MRYDPKFQTIASEGEAQKEKDTSADSKLNDAVINLENEIADLNNKSEYGGSAGESELPGFSDGTEGRT